MYEVYIENPAELPKLSEVVEIQEPFIKAQTLTPNDYVGNIMKLCMDRRGILTNQTYLSETRVDLHWELPLAEVVFDFYDKLKSLTRGYASLDYEFYEYRKGDLVKLDILLNGDPVDAFSSIIHRNKSYDWGKKLCDKLKELIPRQMFEVVISAQSAKIIAVQL